jgi:hypothetical protein
MAFTREGNTSTWPSANPKNDFLHVQRNFDTSTMVAVRVQEGCSSNLPFVRISEALSFRRCFGQPTVDDMLAALEAEGTPWAQRTLAAIKLMSPTVRARTIPRTVLGVCVSSSFGMLTKPTFL